MRVGMGMKLDMPGEVSGEIAVRAMKAHPEEACGILLGRVEGDVIRVVELMLAKNISDTPLVHYVIDPLDLLKGERVAREKGLEVVGYWHSHPTSAPVPSKTDLAEAWEGVVYVIVSGVGEKEMRAWRREGKVFVEVGMVA